MGTFTKQEDERLNVSDLRTALDGVNGANGLNGDRIDLQTILAKLSIPEKVFLLSGSSFTSTGGAPAHGLHKVAVSDALTDIRGSTVFNAPPAAVFPNSTALAATFNVNLLEQVAVELAKEMELKSVDVILAPNLNLQRDPRAGRNQETFGEDPYLSGRCGSAIVKGIQSQGMDCIVKHLVCNDSETHRKHYDVLVDERPLRELYLRPFEMIVKTASPAGIMSAYNKINGHYAASNVKLLTDIVRNEWKYDGLIMSDWFGTYDGVSSLKAGMDLEMPFPAFRGPKLLDALAEGKVSEADIDRCLLRVLRFLARIKAPPNRKAEQATDNDEHRCRCLREVAGEAVMLLKNDHAKLPLRPKAGGKIAIVGALATARTDSHLVSPSYHITPLEGLRLASQSGSWQVEHVHGPSVHVTVPLIDHRYTSRIDFHLWNKGQRVPGATPVSTETYKDAKVAFLMRKVPGLDADFEIEMSAEVCVPKTGVYTFGVVSGSDAVYFIDEEKVYTFVPQGVVDVQKFLFFQHTFEQTFTRHLEADRTYHLTCISQSQKPSGPEPVATGLFCGLVEDSVPENRIKECVELAVACDEAVVCIGTTWEWEMEGVDRQTIALPPWQRQMLEAVIEARKGDVVVVNQSGAAVDLSCAMAAKAILHAHFAGQEAGNAIADILLGRVNPSGRSPYTWPARIEDCPSFDNFPCNKDLSLRYQEGLQMGWRGYDKGTVEPLFSFGHGLSFTSFEISKAAATGIITATSSVKLDMDVTNCGFIAGKEVIQVYVQGLVGSEVERSRKSLEAFAKTKLLLPTESTAIRVELGRRAFSYWSTQANCWEVEAGTYQILLSQSASTIRQILSLEVPGGFQWSGLE